MKRFATLCCLLLLLLSDVRALSLEQDSILIGGRMDSIEHNDIDIELRNGALGHPMRQWSKLYESISDLVTAVAMDSCGKLYLGGDFTSIDGVTTGHAAMYDGASWKPLPNGGQSIFNDRVEVITVGNCYNVNDPAKCACDIYFGGDFVSQLPDGGSVNSAVKWKQSKSSWVSMSNGFPFEDSGKINVMTKSPHADEVAVGTSEAPYFALWTESKGWVVPSSTAFSDSVYGIAYNPVNKGVLYIGGSFYQPYRHMTKYTVSDNKFQQMALFSNVVYNVACVSETEVIMAGKFTMNDLKGVGKWVEGTSTISPIASDEDELPSSPEFYAMQVCPANSDTCFPGSLYVAGYSRRASTKVFYYDAGTKKWSVAGIAKCDNTFPYITSLAVNWPRASDASSQNSFSSASKITGMISLAVLVIAFFL